MVRTIVFIFYILLFCYVYRWTHHHKIQNRFLKESKNPAGNGFLFNALILLGIPYFLIIGAGIIWGYTEQPYNFLRMSLDSGLSLWLIFAIFISLGLSYMLIYRVGYIKADHEAKKRFNDYIAKGKAAPTGR